MLTLKEIRSITGLSQAAFAKHYGIPQRTYESWEMGTRKPPTYVQSMLERLVRIDFETNFETNFETKQ